MRILITGGAGFLGSHITEKLLEWGNKITVLDRLDQTVNLHRLSSIPNWNNYQNTGKVKMVWWDLKAEINNQVSRELGHPDLVIHLAAGSHVDRSIVDPLLFTLDNVVGTCNLLNWIRNTDPKPRLLHASTDEVLGAALNPYYGFLEKDILHPTNPYAATKAGAEMLVKAFSTTYNLQATIIRMTNIIGPKQHQEKAIPKFIRQISAGEEIEIHASSTGVSSTRYYLDYRDLCTMIQRLINEPNIEYLHPDKRDKGIYHISGSQEINNLYLAEQIALKLGKSLSHRFVVSPSYRPYHDLTYHLNSYKIQDLLNYKTLIPLDNSLDHIIEWYKQNPDWL